MNLFKRGKDGGKESKVWGVWFPEIKSLFSIAVLRFEGSSREAFHTHAFNSISWVLRGELVEQHLDGRVERHRPSLLPVITRLGTFHKVDSVGTTTVLTFRGPWVRQWCEYLPETDQYVVLTTGRREVRRTPAGLRWLWAPFGLERTGESRIVA